MLEILRFVKGLTNCVWTHRAKILVLILVMTMVVPQPAKGQFIDVAAIVSAIGAINTAITNVIGGPSCERPVGRSSTCSPVSAR